MMLYHFPADLFNGNHDLASSLAKNLYHFPADLYNGRIAYGALCDSIQIYQYHGLIYLFVFKHLSCLKCYSAL